MKFSSLMGWRFSPCVSPPVSGYWPGSVLPEFSDPLFVPDGAVLRFGLVMGAGTLDWVPGLCVGPGPFDGFWPCYNDASRAGVAGYDWLDTFTVSPPAVVPVWMWDSMFVVVAGSPMCLGQGRRSVASC